MAALTDEQALLRRTGKGWAQAKSPVGAFRDLRDAGAELGFEGAVWSEVALHARPELRPYLASTEGNAFAISISLRASSVRPRRSSTSASFWWAAALGRVRTRRR